MILYRFLKFYYVNMKKWGGYMKNSSIIRKENFGFLVFSYTEKCYLLVREEGEEVINMIINNISNNFDIYTGIDNKYINELIYYGINEKSRIVDNSGLVDRKLFAPLEYYFDFTSKCNLKCPHCYNKKHLNFQTMPSADVRNIINEMYELGINRLHLAGGEPTIEKEEIKNYLQTAKDRKIITSMATNGTLLDEEMCKLLMKMNLFALSISIDGWNEQTNMLKRGKGFFEESINGIKRLLKYRDIYSNDTEICIKPIFDYNTPMIFFEEMVKMSIKLGVDKIKFANPERSLNHEKGHYGKYVTNYYETLSHITKLQKKYEGQIKITNVTNPIVGCQSIGLPGMRGCIGAQELLTINPDGRITPCLMNDTVLGNYYNYGSIKRFLLKEKKLQEYLELINVSVCNSCDIYSLCRGGCQVRKKVEYGKIANVDPLCPKNKKNILRPANKKYSLFQPINVFHSL